MLRRTANWLTDSVQLDYGPFDPARHPAMIDILDTIDRRKGCIFLLQGSIQSWKTLTATLWLMASFVLRPGRSAWYSKSGDAVKEFAAEKFNPLFDASRPVSGLLADGKNLTLRKSFPHVPFALLAAHTQLNRNSKSLENVVCDEPWTYEPGHLKEIQGRYTDFINTFRLLLPTSGPDKGGEVDEIWEVSDQRVWHGRCPACEDLHAYPFFQAEPMDLQKRLNDRGYVREVDGQEVWQPWGGLIWDMSDAVHNADESMNWKALRESVRFECPRCGERFEYSPRVQWEMMAGGQYVAQNAERAERNVIAWHWNALCHFPWPELAVEYVKAKGAMRRGDPSLVEEFWRKRLARAWDIRVTMPKKQAESRQGDYPMGELWSEGQFRIMTIDVQQDHYYVRVRDWAGDVRSRGLWVEKVFSVGRLVEIQREFGVPVHAGELEWDAEGGRYVLTQPCGVFIDGNHYTAQVRRLAVREGWIVLRGRDQGEFRHADGLYYLHDEFKPVDAFAGTYMEGDQYAVEMAFSNAMAMNLLANLQEVGYPEPVWTYERDAPEWYAKQLYAWERVVKRRKKDDSYFYQWVQVEKDDHVHSCEKMQIPAAALAGVVGRAAAAPEGDTAGDSGSV